MFHPDPLPPMFLPTLPTPTHPFPSLAAWWPLVKIGVWWLVHTKPVLALNFCGGCEYHYGYRKVITVVDQTAAVNAATRLGYNLKDFQLEVITGIVILGLMYLECYPRRVCAMAACPGYLTLFASLALHQSFVTPLTAIIYWSGQWWSESEPCSSYFTPGCKFFFNSITGRKKQGPVW